MVLFLYPEHDELLLFTPDVKCPFLCAEIEVLKENGSKDYGGNSTVLQIVLLLLAVLVLLLFCYWLWKKSHRKNDAQNQVMYNEVEFRRVISSRANLLHNICEDFTTEDVGDKDDKVKSSDDVMQSAD